MKRVFIGIPAWPVLKKELEHWSREISALVPGAAVVLPEGSELTLAFLGQLDDNDIATVSRVLSEASLPQPFTIELSGPHFFPPHTKRMLALVGPLTPPLIKLVAAVQSVTASIGYRPPARAFVPHITLARLRKEGSNDLQIKQSTASLQVTQVNLYESTLGPSGARHEILGSYKL